MRRWAQPRESNRVWDNAPCHHLGRGTRCVELSSREMRRQSSVAEAELRCTHNPNRCSAGVVGGTAPASESWSAVSHTYRRRGSPEKAPALVSGFCVAHSIRAARHRTARPCSST